jgi:hypothetical protein
MAAAAMDELVTTGFLVDAMPKGRLKGGIAPQQAEGSGVPRLISENGQEHG